MIQSTGWIGSESMGM